MSKKPVSRKKLYSIYDDLLAEIPPKSMKKRPKYLNSIGIFRGGRGDTAWVKIHLPKGGIYKGKYYKAGQSVEIKVGNLESFAWEDLENLRRDYQTKADNGLPLEDSEVPLFQDYADNWLAVQENRHRGYKTTLGIVKNHLKVEFGAKPLNAISTSDVNRWQGAKLKTHAEASVKRQRVVLSSILSAAYRDGYIEKNPCEKADTLKVPEREPRCLSGTELALLLICAKEQKEWLPDYIFWAVHSGMRRGEIRDLKWQHVVELPNGETLLRFPTGKTQKIRTIHCSPAMKNILKEQIRRKESGDDRVFPISQTTLVRKWRLARAAAGLPDLRIQDLRSTNATYAAGSGVDLRTLAGRLGHSDLTMLERHYAGFLGTSASEASHKIEAGIGKALEQGYEHLKGLNIAKEDRYK